MKLETIGFYTLEDKRVLQTSETSPMWRGEIIITEYCNFKCPYCRGLSPDIYKDKRKKQLSYAEIKRVIDIWCKNKPIRNIRFSGGEPTIHPDILKIVGYAKQKGVNRIAISTNGSNTFKFYKQLIKAGVNDFSISLDACCAKVGDKMNGGINGAWEKVIGNIRKISKLVYVTVGVVYNEDNIADLKDTIKFSHDLGVADIRIISAAQYNKDIKIKLSKEILDKHPILKYRLNNINKGESVRGLKKGDAKRCNLLHDDAIVAGGYHFPCVIYMREQGNPIGKVNSNMRKERIEWLRKHDCHKDGICKKNCLDVCIAYNNRFRELRE